MRQILLTRMPVSMGDDSRDTSLVIEVDENWKLQEIINKILDIDYLPQIMGGKATWSIAYNNPLCVIAQQWDKPEFIGIGAGFPGKKDKDFNRLHFNYHVQEDPELVLDVLRRFRTMF